MLCGMMRGHDAARSSQAGAAYLGVVFARGPRAVTQISAREVVAAAAGVSVLGVFADQSPDEILRIAELCALSGAQLHGPYSSPDAARLRTHGLEIWRVVRIALPADSDAVENAEVRAASACRASEVLAGGLRPDNVDRRRLRWRRRSST
jgi:phosphoribosylanthranilate isomerase